MIQKHRARKLFAVAAVLVLLTTGAYTAALLNDTETGTATFEAGNTGTSQGDQQTNDVGVCIGGANSGCENGRLAAATPPVLGLVESVVDAIP